MGLHTNGVDAAIRPAPLGDLVETFIDVFFVHIDRLGSGFLSQCDALGDAIDCYHSARPEHEGAPNAELADGAATPYRYGVTGFDAGKVCGLITRWENIGQE